MNFLELNLAFLSAQNGIEFHSFLKEHNVLEVGELTFDDLQDIATNFEVELSHLLFRNLVSQQHATQNSNIKLLVLDVDGVMTDGGMYFTESGDQFKKFNTKDGMGIMKLQQSGTEVCIISSGFKGESIKARAEMLGIKRCYVGRDPKILILNNWMTELGISIKNVAMIGDDINDLPIIEIAAISACPSDAIPCVQDAVDVKLTLKGGEGCVREFIDNFLLTIVQ
jgi:3-deoxy-D-manno-octulosonate 8-phosphate phosphatase (KDO 8-P phosphatase)